MTEFDVYPEMPLPAERRVPDASSLRLPFFRTLSPLHRRFLAVLCVLSVIATVWLVESNRQHQAFLNLWSEITNAGGDLRRVSFLWFNWLPAPWDHYFADRQIQAELTGETIDSDWLHQHDDLTAVGINCLKVYESPLSGSEIARLVEKHPIQILIASRVADTDVIAGTLTAKKSLQVVKFYNTDLTDAGFRALPLELLTGISVPDSAVTSNSFQELRRCRLLEWAELDGRQFDDSVAELLCGELRMIVLSLVGEDVTDEHLARIKGDSLLRVVLTDTSATQSGIAALQKSLPTCQIRVY